MDVTTEKIIEDTALLLGLDPGLPGGATQTEYPSLAARIYPEIEDCAREAVEGLPLRLVSGWLPLGGEGVTVDSDGAVTLPLPSGFLLLHSLRMTDWETAATTVLPSGHWLAPLQSGRYPALRGTPSRPLLFHWLTPEGEPALRAYSSGPGARLAEGWYLPAPAIDAEGHISIPPAAYMPMLRLIAGRIGEGMA